MGNKRKLALIYESRQADKKTLRDCYDIVDHVRGADHVLVIPTEKNRLIVMQLNDQNPDLAKRPKEMFFQNTDMLDAIRNLENKAPLIKMNSLLLCYHATYECKPE